MLKLNGNDQQNNGKQLRSYRQGTGVTTEEKRLLNRQEVPLLNPLESQSLQHIDEQGYALERSLHFDDTVNDPWSVALITSEFVAGFDTLSCIPVLATSHIRS